MRRYRRATRMSCTARAFNSWSKRFCRRFRDLIPQVTPAAQLAQAVEANVRWTVRQIMETPEGRGRLAEGRLKLAGAIYEIESGRVRFLD